MSSDQTQSPLSNLPEYFPTQRSSPSFHQNATTKNNRHSFQFGSSSRGYHYNGNQHCIPRSDYSELDVSMSDLNFIPVYSSCPPRNHSLAPYGECDGPLYNSLSNSAGEDSLEEFQIHLCEMAYTNSSNPVGGVRGKPVKIPASSPLNIPMASPIPWASYTESKQRSGYGRQPQDPRNYNSIRNNPVLLSGERTPSVSPSVMMNPMQLQRTSSSSTPTPTHTPTPTSPPPPPPLPHRPEYHVPHLPMIHGHYQDPNQRQGPSPRRIALSRTQSLPLDIDNNRIGYYPSQAMNGCGCGCEYYPEMEESIVTPSIYTPTLSHTQSDGMFMIDANLIIIIIVMIRSR